MASQLNSKTSPTYTLAEGAPIARSDTAVQIRQNGGGLLLLQDTQLIETLAHFARERIPERVVHAKAAGAFGTFEVTHDISDITSAKFLNGVGKKTPALARISTVGGEKGSADTVRDVRGWAIKFYTEEGNQDWVFNNTPVFFIRDPIKFPSLNRSHKRHPQTNLQDATMFWDYHNNNPEGLHQLMILFSDRGTPYSLRHTSAFSGHTYKFSTATSFNYVKIHLLTNQGIKNFTSAEATKLAGEEPDHNTKDLFDSIEKGEYPSWTAYVQVMSKEQAEGYKWNIFDMTKVWPHADFPLRPFGKLTLNKNPSNYFRDIEQAAFSPSTMVPGILPSADPILQARMFSYPDAARYRLGTNYQLLPSNHALSPIYSPYQRDGFANFSENYGPDPNYVNSGLRPLAKPVHAFGNEGKNHDEWAGQVASWTSEMNDVDFEQPRALWGVFGRTGQRGAFVANVSDNLKEAIPRVRADAIKIFSRVDEEMGRLIEERVEKDLKVEK
ncbi:catalase [Tricladium varicosporioides]|nr:catalase [Hymenoscyphus varicosporioides]